MKHKRSNMSLRMGKARVQVFTNKAHAKSFIAKVHKSGHKTATYKQRGVYIVKEVKGKKRR